jgi:hypothetical protein
MNYFAWCMDQGDRPETPNVVDVQNETEAAIAYVKWRERKWGEYLDVVECTVEKEDHSAWFHLEVRRAMEPVYHATVTAIGR